jgi:hypothetical protein
VRTMPTSRDCNVQHDLATRIFRTEALSHGGLWIIAGTDNQTACRKAACNLGSYFAAKVLCQLLNPLEISREVLGHLPLRYLVNLQRQTIRQSAQLLSLGVHLVNVDRTHVACRRGLRELRLPSYLRSRCREAWRVRPIEALCCLGAVGRSTDNRREIA